MDDKNSLSKPATKKDIAELRSATKKDIFKLKKEITILRTETKNDIAELRAETKKDIAELRTETKKDIAELRSATKSEFVNLRGEIADLRNQMFNHFDGLAKLIRDQMEEFQIHKMTHQREQEQLDDHEKRISNLEAGGI